jgi:hypothetical protein
VEVFISEKFQELETYIIPEIMHANKQWSYIFYLSKTVQPLWTLYYVTLFEFDEAKRKTQRIMQKV